MINPNKTLQLFINGVEYEFSNNIDFDFHPTNFSTITFHDAIPKADLAYPECVKIKKIDREFSFAEVYQEGKLIFFGTVNDTGRLSLMPNYQKTRSIIITDFRNWLSLSKPINVVWRNATPQKMVEDVLFYLNEPKFEIGNLDFTENDIVKAYNGAGKTAYQLLKNVISKQSNSVLYFTVENEKIKINYKSNAAFENISPIKLDINNNDFLENYKIEDILFENSADQYANFLKYESENLIGNKMIEESNLPLNEKKVTLNNQIAKVETDPKYTYILRNDIKKPVVILNEKEAKTGKYYDISYKQNSNVLEILRPNENDKLFIGYYTKSRFGFEELNKDEIDELAKNSKTKGIVYQYEKFNDISTPEDLLKLIRSDINKKSNKQFTINVISSKPIWDLMETVEVKVNNQDLDGKYLVHHVTGNFKVSGDTQIHNYNYILKQNKNIDNYLNAFDNQSYRDSPNEEFTYFFTGLTTFKATIEIVFEEY